MSAMQFSEDHEWLAIEGGVATVGITAYAQEQLGDVVFVELPEAGKALEKGEEAAVVESVKAASEIFAPLTGEVTEANEALADDPSQMTVADPTQLEGLMDEAAYKEFIEGLD